MIRPRLRFRLRWGMVGVAAGALACGGVVEHERAWSRWYREVAEFHERLARACPAGEDCPGNHDLLAGRARLKARPWSTPRPWRWPDPDSALAHLRPGPR